MSVSFDTSMINSFNSYARKALENGIEYHSGKDIKHAIEANCLDKDGNLDLKRLEAFCQKFGVGQINPRERLDHYSERCFAGYKSKFGSPSVFKNCEEIEKSGVDGKELVNNKDKSADKPVGLGGYHEADKHKLSLVA